MVRSLGFGSNFRYLSL